MTQYTILTIKQQIKNCIKILKTADYLSRVCAVAQYAVLEANAKVNGRGQFSNPHPSERPRPISMSCQIYYYVPPGSWCAKFGWNRFGRYGSAHAWKKRFCVNFFIINVKLNSLNMVLEAKSRV